MSIFPTNAVVEHLDDFQDVKRYTQDDWEILSRHPVKVRSFDTIETVKAFPAYPEGVLYVASQGLIPRAPDITPIEVFVGDGMKSFPIPSGQADLSDFSFYDSDPYNSNYTQLTMFLLCINHRTEHESTPHFARVPGIAVKRPIEFMKRFPAALLWGLQTLKDNLLDLNALKGDGQAEYARITTLLQSDLDL
ncbi:hypothetical protein BG015_001142 [Linnemannia schmuckeri]|uniref:Uncharacterized protein n=1 Tax=Linnemannia schmuckeri TaxID=64567 RepID=A0A9P5VDI8_9FUNG|nr:hypothetical protein BG015_001142 [Linnemannia schmuckeri]